MAVSPTTPHVWWTSQLLQHYCCQVYLGRISPRAHCGYWVIIMMKVVSYWVIIMMMVVSY